MKIKKLKSGLYELKINDVVYQLYDEVILKYTLLTNKNVDSMLLASILKDNDFYCVYYKALKYITKKLRTEKELYKYLIKEFDKSIVFDVINKIKELGYLDESLYIKSFVNDQINLGNNGPLKIKSKLLVLGVNELLIEEYLNSIDEFVWEDKINRYINKSFSSNTKYSVFKLKGKLMINLVNLGFDSLMISNVISNYDFNDNNILIKEYNKYLNKYQKKYSDKELKYMLFKKLSSLGFSYEDVNEVLEQ